MNSTLVKAAERRGSHDMLRISAVHSGRTSRRTFLALSIAFCASSAYPVRAATGPFFQRHKLPLGLQLYTVAAAIKDDLAATLKAVARMGYQTVELAGLMGKTSAEWQSALKETGLHCRAAHIPPRTILPGPSLQDDPGSIAELARVIGFDTVVCPIVYIPDRVLLKLNSGEPLAQMLAQLTERDWLDTAQFLNAKGAALRTLGLRLAYHNHNNEFAPVGATTGLAILMQNTDPKMVSFEMDAGWVASAGVDPLSVLARYPGRFSGMHVKDIKPSNSANYRLKLDPAEMGQGVIDWSKLLARAYAGNVRQFYVEQEPPYVKSPLEEAAAGIQYLKGIV